MQIQINTDKNVSLTQERRDALVASIANELSRFDNQLTRIEVHLTDQDGIKQGQNDNRCMIEARPGGLQPIAVTDNADTYEKAVNGAVGKLVSALDTVIGRLRNR